MNEVEALKEKVNQWAKTIGVNPKKIKINKMNRKWATCSSQGIITFNRELLKEDIQFCEYVIVHRTYSFTGSKSWDSFQIIIKSLSSG